MIDKRELILIGMRRLFRHIRVLRLQQHRLGCLVAPTSSEAPRRQQTLRSEQKTTGWVGTVF